jgi:hypothetical protein
VGVLHESLSHRSGFKAPRRPLVRSSVCLASGLSGPVIGL